MTELIAREFTGLMEDYLEIPALVCELIEKKLLEGKFEEVIEYVVLRRKEIANSTDVEDVNRDSNGRIQL